MGGSAFLSRVCGGGAAFCFVGRLRLRFMIVTSFTVSSSVASKNKHVERRKVGSVSARTRKRRPYLPELWHWFRLLTAPGSGWRWRRRWLLPRPLTPRVDFADALQRYRWSLLAEFCRSRGHSRCLVIVLGLRDKRGRCQPAVRRGAR